MNMDLIGLDPPRQVLMADVLARLLHRSSPGDARRVDKGMHEVSKERKEHAAPSGCAVLIIDDDHNTVEGLRLLFEFDGFSVSVAENAIEGLRLARLRRPQAVVCDIDLAGVLSGFDVAVVLRNDPVTASAFLVAVTACEAPRDRVRGARAGFAAYLSKPVSYQDLLEVVRRGVDHRAH